MDAIVGYSGFVGSNLCLSHTFDYQYNSKNIQDAFGLKPDVLVYAGVPAQKFIANTQPQKDEAVILNAIENIKSIAPKALVLISTIDVYKNPKDVDEASEMVTEDLQPYGLNRLALEDWVRAHSDMFERSLIVRLPGLFGEGLKKNFLYDMIHVIPSMLNQQKYDELSVTSDLIKENYHLLDNGFYKVGDISKEIRDKLIADFKSAGFTALNFTDSRAKFQFYSLSHLWEDIQTALRTDIETINLATAPISAGEVYQMVTGEVFENELNKPIPDYDFKTNYADIFNGKNGYIEDKTQITSRMVAFVADQKRKG